MTDDQQTRQADEVALLRSRVASLERQVESMASRHAIEHADISVRLDGQQERANERDAFVLEQLYGPDGLHMQMIGFVFLGLNVFLVFAVVVFMAMFILH